MAYLDDVARIQYAATHRPFFHTEKQRVWANIYSCAYTRWAEGHNQGDYDTMVAALGLGDQFWQFLL